MGHIYWSCCVNATSLSRLALRAAPASKRTTVLPSEFGSIATLRLKIMLGEKRRLNSLESVREHQAGLQSFRSMRRIDARRKNDSALRLRFSQSLASRRQRLSHAMVRSTTQRRGRITKPLA